MTSQRAKRGSRPVCVRTCDGFFFPVPATPRGGKTPADLCQATCPNAETVLFRAPADGDIEQAVSERGKPYTQLANASRYKKVHDPACSCKAKGETWAQVLRGAEAMLSRHKEDVVVTAAKAEEMARPKRVEASASGKSGCKARPAPWPRSRRCCAFRAGHRYDRHWQHQAQKPEMTMSGDTSTKRRTIRPAIATRCGSTRPRLRELQPVRQHDSLFARGGSALGARHGIGRELVDAVMRDIRRRGLTARPLCPFVAAHVMSNPRLPRADSTSLMRGAGLRGAELGAEALATSSRRFRKYLIRPSKNSLRKGALELHA